MNYKLIFFGFILFSQAASPQYVSLKASSGYNVYEMTTLKKIQRGTVNHLENNLDIPVKSLDQFPSYYNFQFQLQYKDLNSVNFGIIYDFASTGGRVNYKDYSGSYILDQVISKNSFGLSYEYYFFTANSFSISLFGEFYFYSTRLKITEELRVLGQAYSRAMNLETDISFGLLPGFSFEYFLLPVSVAFSTGYLIDSSNEFHYEGNDQLKFLYNNKAVETEWDALRFSLSASVLFDIH